MPKSEKALCASQREYIATLEWQIKALETALENSRRSLAAEGKNLKKARYASQEAKKRMDEVGR
ncbi:hypothetical protein LJC48_01065 [Desulfovibrio sp. OttesenSCG-928-C06]|nr:hypothetical protein [Desulfovibrio sp. OttesenSCG-928-C06]